MPHRRSWHSSPPLLSPPLLIILFPIVVLTLLFLAVPPLLSASTRLLRAGSVKTSWDSLNILLVVFAILCGVFARRNDDEQTPNNHVNVHDDDAVSDRNATLRRVPSEVQSQWFGFSSEEKKVHGNDTPLVRVKSPATGGNGLRMRRNSSSYPDLRQRETDDDRYKFRFYDDFEIDKQFRSPAREYFPAFEHRKRWPESPPSPQSQQHQQEEGQQEDRVKDIQVDTFEIRPSPPPVKSTIPTPVKSSAPPPVKSTTPPPPPPPLPPPLPEYDGRITRRTHRKIERERESEITVELGDRVFTTIRSPPPAPPTPSAKTRSERKSERKKSTVKREMAMIWASVLSNQRKKKKKQKTKNNENHDQHYDDNVDELTNNTTLPPPTPPPPPPPPPPPSVFHSLFRKGLGKSKKVHSVSPPPPPPPPPPSKRKSQIPPPDPPRRRNTGRPPLPNRTVTFNNESLNAGNQSPLIPVPPPPPPFKMKAMKFVVRGDYVKIRSNQSSRCSSPERDDIINVSETTTTINDEAVTDAVADSVNDTVTDRYVFCPSPDVNVKAATFIARLRGEWRLEKLNSLKEKANGSLPSSLLKTE